MKRVIYLIAILLSVFNAWSQANGDYRSIGSVTLTNATNWEVYNSGTTLWATTTTAPNTAGLTTGNTITIQAGHTWGNTATASIPAGVTLYNKGVVGTFTASLLTLNGTYIHFNTGSAITVYAGLVIATGSTFVYRSSSIFPSQTSIVATVNGRTYYNLVFDTDGTIPTAGIPRLNQPGMATNCVVNGDLTIDSWWIDISNTTAGNNGSFDCKGNLTLSGTGTRLGIRSCTIAAGKTLTIGAADSLGVVAPASGGSNIVLTINGTLDNKSIKTISFASTSTTSMVVNGIYKHNADANTIPKSTNITYATGSTIQVLGAVNTIPVIPTSCYNVVWNSPSQLASSSNTFLVSPSTTTINGDLSIVSTGGAFIFQSGTATVRTLNILGNLNISGGNLRIVSSNINTGVDQNMTVGGSINVSGGTFYLSDATSPSTARGLLSLTGGLNHTAGIFGVSSTAVVSSGVLTFTGNNTNQSISTIGVSGGLVVNIDKTAAGSIALASSFSINASGVLNVTTGSFILNGFTTTLKSTSATNTARVYVAAGASIDQSVTNSKFIVEQFIPGGTRSYRFLGHPFNTAINLSEVTDDINITGNDGGVTGTGFSATTANSPSSFWYNPNTGNGSSTNDNTGWIPFTRNDGVNAAVTATSNTWKQGQGIRLFIRGSLDQPNILTSSPTPNDVTLDLSGNINDGNDVPVLLTKGASSGYNLVSNPYCAPLDLFQFRTANGNANAGAGNNFYVWLPTGGVNAKGQYVTGDMTNAAETYRYLPAYASVFFNPATTNTVTFKESHKAANTQAASYNSRNSIVDNGVQLQLSRDNKFEDRVIVTFSNKATIKSNVDEFDALKLMNSNLNFYSISADNKALAIDKRPESKDGDVISKLGFSTTLKTTYSIDVKSISTKPNMVIYLRDKFLNAQIELVQDASYNFDVTQDPASQGDERFELTYKTVKPIEFENSFTLTVSPNPVKDILTISFNTDKSQKAFVDITNANGQRVQSINTGNLQNGKLSVNIKGWAKGIYYVTVSNAKGKSVKAIQVQ